MKKLMTVLLILFFSAPAIYAVDGAIAGKIGEINNLTGEIVVNTGNDKSQTNMGDKLYVRINGNPVIMKATFPMLTIIKCKLTGENKNSLKDIVKGMVVYKYKPGIEKKEEAAVEPDKHITASRRIARSVSTLPIQYHNTIWKIVCPGGNPALYYVTFKPDGSLGYSYKDPESLQFDNTDTWHTEGETLVIVWTNGYSTEKFQIVPGLTRFNGTKTSKNWDGQKECSIEKVVTAQNP